MAVATLCPKSKIATKLFPFTDTLVITFKQKNRFWQVILTGSSFRNTRTLTNGPATPKKIGWWGTEDQKLAA